MTFAIFQNIVFTGSEISLMFRYPEGALLDEVWYLRIKYSSALRVMINQFIHIPSSKAYIFYNPKNMIALYWTGTFSILI